MAHIDDIRDYYGKEEQEVRENRPLFERVRLTEGDIRFLDREQSDIWQTVLDQQAHIDEVEARLDRLVIAEQPTGDEVLDEVLKGVDDAAEGNLATREEVEDAFTAENDETDDDLEDALIQQRERLASRYYGCDGRVDEAIRTYPSDAEHDVYEMVMTDSSPDLGDYDLAIGHLVEDYIQGLSREDIDRIRGDTTATASTAGDDEDECTCWETVDAECASDVLGHCIGENKGESA
jgi:hypothetical protein